VAAFSTMPSRKLRIFAFDPSMSRRHETLPINEVIVSIPWEMERADSSKPFLGPTGRYVEVVDFDPSLDLFYAPIDLHDPRLLADNGLRPAEWNPQFHQQMVYAVAMNTIAKFESALGRVALWASHAERNAGELEHRFVQCLRIYPHALRDANAYYSPTKKALLFGYFEAQEGQRGAPPGTTIFTCLSHDIIAHETSHALLDGMHPRFNEASNPDVLALHEGFADIVAIFQHFSFPDVLKDQIARTRGDLQSQNLLGQLAQEFGQVLGRGVALRNALGGVGSDGVWKADEPDPKKLQAAIGPHARGSVLVAAVFRAFLSIYRSRIVDLLRIASGGTGVLGEGELHPDLVNRLAGEAAKSAEHVLQMCIRALDYCPPVDVTFGDYLRAILTADHDLFPEDEHNYRVALLEAFLAWGIVPRNVSIVSVETLLWPTMRDVAANYNAVAPSVEGLKDELALLLLRPVDMIVKLKARNDFHDHHGELFRKSLDKGAIAISEAMETAMTRRVSATPRSKPKVEEILARNLLQLGLEADRKVEWLVRDLYARLFWGMVTEPASAGLCDVLGLITRSEIRTVSDSEIIVGAHAIEVHSVRMATRRGDRNEVEREYVVELTQTRDGYLDPDMQMKADKGERGAGKADFKFRWGCTLLIDAESFEIRRVIRTPGTIINDKELSRVRDYLIKRADAEDNAFSDIASEAMSAETFARLHMHLA
jgi:hypothetical protein